MKKTREEKLKTEKKKTSALYWKNMRPYYLMLLPGLILIIIFRFCPLYGMLVAFKDYDMFRGFSESPWVGLKWFRILFESRDFYNILRNTLVISFLDLIFTFFGSIVFAILINEIQGRRYKKLVQTVSYLPHFLSWVVVGGLVIQLLSSDSFLVRSVADMLNIAPKNILLEQQYFFPVIVVAEMWKSIGWGTILFLAAMSGISPELYEAARVDGAGKFKQIWYITLPGIKFIMVIQLLMRIGGIMNVGFEKVFVLQNSMILDVAEVFSTYNYKVGIGQWNMSFSSALSFFESLTNFILVFVFDRIAKLLGEEGLL
ncbi:MAG: sugar ABC transporter permease [Clostridia bacterium]|nr:sugar ABC transporter permease [Clostridia bacterium]